MIIDKIMSMDWSDERKTEAIRRCLTLCEERVKETQNDLNYCKEMIYQLEEKGGINEK